MDVSCNFFLFPVVIICQPGGEPEPEGEGGFAHLGLELSTGSRTYNSDSITPPMIIVYSGLCCFEK